MNVKRNFVLAVFSLALMVLVGQTLANHNTGDRFDHRDWGRGQRIILRFNDLHLRGTNVLHLKQEIRHQHPGLRMRGMRVTQVNLVAKSKHGRGQARLIVDGYETYSEIVNGNPYDFHNMDPFTFDKIGFRNPNPSRMGRGPLQIKLQGNIIVRKVVLKVMRGGMGPGPGPRPRPIMSFETIGSEKFSKFTDERRSFSVNRSHVMALKLIGSRSDVFVSRAIVVLDDGTHRPILDFEGRIDRGEQRVFNLGSGRFPVGVRRVVITATSTDPIGSRGQLSLEVGTFH